MDFRSKALCNPHKLEDMDSECIVVARVASYYSPVNLHGGYFENMATCRHFVCYKDRGCPLFRDW